MAQEAIFSKPNKPIYELSKPQQNRYLLQIKQLFNLLSHNNEYMFIEYLCNKTTLGKKLYEDHYSYKINNIIQNILQLYNTGENSQKLALLSLLANEFQLNFLKEKGFNITKDQHLRAKEKNKLNKATLKSYQRIMPASKRKISNETISKIVTICLENSKIIQKPNIKKIDFINFEILIMIKL